MTQRIENQRNRLINFLIGLALAILHAVAAVNFLTNNSRFADFSGTPLMAALVKAVWLASVPALAVTIVLLALVKRIKQFPSVLMVLMGNYLCPLLLAFIFQTLFYRAVSSHWTNSAEISNPKLILYELFKLNAYDCILGLLAGITLSGLMTLVRHSPGEQRPENK